MYVLDKRQTPQPSKEQKRKGFANWKAIDQLLDGINKSE